MRVLFLEVDTEADWAVASLGPSTITAYIRQAGHDATMFRATVDHDAADVIEHIRAENPGILGISLTTKQWQRARRLVAEIRARIDIPVVAGGLHPTFAPEEVLANPGFDYVCLGEGEESMRDLLDALDGGAATDSIANIWVKGGRRPAMRPPFSPLDDMPFMARDVLDEKPGVIHISTQRGCPFPCTYCAARMWNELYEEGSKAFGRRRSVDNVIAELKEIRSRGPLVWVAFLDDTFTLHHPWVRDFCDRYEDEIGVDFSVLARVETVNERLMHRLAKAGCKMVTYGIESGSYRVRRDILSRPVKNQRFKDVMRWTADAGMMSVNNYMLGLPGETREDLEQTLQLAAELDAYDFAYYVFYPFPGTHLFRVCQSRGLLPDDYLDLPANHRTSILELEHLSHDDIAEYYEKFTQLRLHTWLKRQPEGGGDSSIAEHIAKVAETF